MEQAIVDVLENDADVSAIIGDRIFPLVIPQEKALPAITYERVDTDPNDTKSGASTLDGDLIDLDLWGKDFAVLKDLAKKIRTTLDRFSGTRQGIIVQSIQYQNQVVGFSAEKNIYHLIQTYKVRETNP